MILSIVLAATVAATVLPKGMEDWYMVNHCEDEYWIDFFSKKNSSNNSISYLLNLVKEPVLNPAIGFRCATAVASVCEEIAKLLDFEKKIDLSLKFRQISSIFLSFDFTMKGTEWIDSSVWGMKWSGSIEGVLSSMKRVQQEGIDRGKTMRELLKNRPKNQKMKIGIVSVCDYDSSITDLSKLSRLNKEEYSDLHQYELFFFEKAPRYSDWWDSHGNIYSDRPPAWSKIDAMLTVMSGQSLDWLMWMDCDSFFMDMEIRIEDLVNMQSACDFACEVGIQKLANWVPTQKSQPILDQLGEYNALANTLIKEPLVKSLIISEDGLMLNSGIFFLKKSVSSYFVLQKIRQFTFFKNPTTFHSWWEQTAMVLLMSESLFEYKPIPDWVDLMSQKQLNVYPPLIAGMLSTHVAYDVGDYIVSFSGCKIYTSQTVCNNMFEAYFYL